MNARKYRPGRYKPGPDHPQWKGNLARQKTGRIRAERSFPDIGMCEQCQDVPAYDRHHIDGDTLNNDRSNIQFLCRKCHLIIDGRLVSLHSLPRPIKPPTPCVVCGAPYKPLRRGRCERCRQYFKRHGCERCYSLDRRHADWVASQEGRPEPEPLGPTEDDWRVYGAVIPWTEHYDRMMGGRDRRGP